MFLFLFKSTLSTRLADTLSIHNPPCAITVYRVVHDTIHSLRKLSFLWVHDTIHSLLLRKLLFLSARHDTLLLRKLLFLSARHDTLLLRSRNDKTRTWHTNRTYNLWRSQTIKRADSPTHPQKFMKQLYLHVMNIHIYIPKWNVSFSVYIGFFLLCGCVCVWGGGGGRLTSSHLVMYISVHHCWDVT